VAGPDKRSALEYIVFRDIQTMDTQGAREGLDPKHASWLENVQPIGPSQLLQVPGLIAALATLPSAVTRAFFATFTGGGGADPTNVIDWAVVFTVAGSGHVIQLSTGAVTNFAAAGTFSKIPDVTQWKSERILINDPQAGYATYDNLTFVVAGGVSPNIVVTNGGSGYGAPPTVTISGGTGSGATAISQITNGVVTKVLLTNPGSGYLPGDVLTVTFGSGAATATAIIWPFIGGSFVTLSPIFAITNPGFYYYAAPTVTITGGSGTGATAVSTISGGGVVGIQLTNSGSGWQAGNVIVVTIGAPPAGVQATAHSDISGGLVGFTFTVDDPGSGYPSPPTVTLTGGGGSGATAHAVLTDGKVTAVVGDSPGTNYTSGPTVTIDAPPAPVTATATEEVIAGTGGGFAASVAVFQGRVWLSSGRLLTYTGTLGFDDTNPANAAGSTVITDADLKHSITALRSLNNYLYIFGDGAIKQIGAITVSGTTTLFNILSLSSDQGTTFPMTIQSHERLVLFANTVGVFAVYGASVQKISDMMDGLYRTVNFALDLQAAVGDVNNIRCYCLLVNALDLNNQLRSMFMCYFNKRWFLVSGSSSEVAVAQMALGNTLQVYSSSGTDFTRMFANAAQTQVFIVQTALTDNGKPYMGKRALRIGTMQEATAGGTLFLSSDTEQSQVTISFTQPVGFFWEETQAAGSGLLLGATLSGVIAGLSLDYIMIEYQETGPMKSSNLTN
jgi:hypothetical protein